jgi:hypothetical protein
MQWPIDECRGERDDTRKVDGKSLTSHAQLHRLRGDVRRSISSPSNRVENSSACSRWGTVGVVANPVCPTRWSPWCRGRGATRRRRRGAAAAVHLPLAAPIEGLVVHQEHCDGEKPNLARQEGATFSFALSINPPIPRSGVLKVACPMRRASFMLPQSFLRCFGFLAHA